MENFIFCEVKTVKVFTASKNFCIFQCVLTHRRHQSKYCLSNLRIHNGRYTVRKAKFKVEMAGSFSKLEQIFSFTFCKNIVY